MDPLPTALLRAVSPAPRTSARELFTSGRKAVPGLTPSTSGCAATSSAAHAPTRRQGARPVARLLLSLSAGLVLAACGGSAGSAGGSPASSAGPPSAASAKPASAASSPASAKPASASAKPAASSAASASAKPAASGAAGASTKPAASGSASAATAGSLATVTYGGMVPAPVSDAGIYIADAKGWFAEQGIKLDVQNFATAADAVAPLARDQLAVAGGSTGAGLSNAVNRGVDVYITADKATTTPGHGYAGIIVRSDLKDQIKSPADFKGRKVAIGGKAIAPESALAQALKTANLTPKDVDLTAMPIPNMPAAMAGKSIDIAIPVEPTVTAIVSQGTGVLLARTDKYEPNEQFAVLLYSPGFAKGPLAEKFMAAYLKGVRYYDDAFDKKIPAARQEVIDILAAKTTLKDKALYDKVVMPGLDPDGKVNIQDLKLQEAYYLSSGEQQKPTDFDKLVNMSFAEAAVKQLGPYSR